MSDDERKPWDRLPEEPELWYRRFREYLDQEPPRSLLRVYKAWAARKGKKRQGKKAPKEIDFFPSTWGEKRDEYHWRERAAAYDREQTDQLLREKEKKRRAHEELEAEGSLLMYKKAVEMIALPTVIQEEEAMDDETGQQKKIVLMPGNPKHFTAAARLFAQASVNGRLAHGMPTHISYSEKKDTGKPNEAPAFVGVLILPDNNREQPAIETTATLALPEPVLTLPDNGTDQ